MNRNHNTDEKFNILVEDAFYSRSHNKVLVLRDDEKVWDVFANVVVYSELSDELIETLYAEWFEEEVLAILMSNIEVGTV
jgi:hypothetical protein